MSFLKKTFTNKEKIFLTVLSWVCIFSMLQMTVSYKQVYAVNIATTTLTTTICGDSIVSGNEECDVVGETGAYSTTITGRQCDIDCTFGPYCGDAILQTIYGEECDDGNNDSGDFCSSTCTIEPAGSGGGGSSGGGNQSSGGSNIDLGDTVVRISGKTSPRATVNILLDGQVVGTVRANSNGEFEFATNASPGTVTMGFWIEDDNDVRSVVYNTTFDITQGAISDITGLLIPPTITVSDPTINPGDTLTFSGYAIPDATVKVFINDGSPILETTSDDDGFWEVTWDTIGVLPAKYTARARFEVGSGNLVIESNFSSTLQLFIGVDGSPTIASDLNRDTFINLIDFSILIFWWGTDGGDSDPPADINQNGKVGLEDFSILLFNWTG